MTFREMLKLYKDGTLPDEQKKQVETEIEKHEAISDYLYEDADVPALADFITASETKKNEPQSAQFIKLVNATIRRAFIKMGVVVGTVVLAAVLVVMLVLPDFVSAFYYNPNAVVGVSSYNSETKKMALDLSVFTELFLPGTYRNDVIADAEGYGIYRITIPETVSYDGKNITVSGKLEKGKLTLYDPNLLKYPAANAFVLPEGAEGGHHGYGAAGSTKDAFARLEKLNADDYYFAYFSLDELTDYESFHAEFGKEALWCGVYNGNASPRFMGINMTFSGSIMDWDRETYPKLCLLDGESTIETIDISEDAEAMQTHFISMLRYMNDHPEAIELFGGGAIAWNQAIEYVEQNGLQIYGFAVIAKKDTLKEIAEHDMVSYVYTVSLR